MRSGFFFCSSLIIVLLVLIVILRVDSSSRIQSVHQPSHLYVVLFEDLSRTAMAKC